jgi:Cellulase (glycosyl hydrolase family 5)
MRRLLSLIAVLLCLLPAAPALADSSQTVSFEAPNELLNDELRDQTLDEISAFGVHALRVVLYWNSVAPDADAAVRPAGFDATDPSAYPQANWAPYDKLFAAARKRGIDQILVTISGPVPRWATARKRDHLSNPNADDFKDFVTAVGRRYADQVSMWSVWNEPNQPQFLLPQFSHGQPESPRIYRGLFIAAVAGLRNSGNGNDTILLGETSPRGTSHVVAPITFLRGVLCLSASYHRSRKCGRLPASGYAHHAYTTRAGPSFRPVGKNDVTIGVLSRLTGALNRAAAAGAIRRNLPVYLTEFGVQSFPDKLLGVPLDQQAEFRSIAERIAYRNPRVRWFSQYLMRDDQPRPGPSFQRYSGFESGLRFADGNPKPSYDEFRLPLVVERRPGHVSLWGVVRPAKAATTVTIEYRKGTSGAWKLLGHRTTNARGYWSRSAGGAKGRRWRVSWVAPDGTTYVGTPTRAY